MRFSVRNIFSRSAFLPVLALSLMTGAGSPAVASLSQYETLAAGASDWLALLDAADRHAWQQQGLNAEQQERANQRVFALGEAFLRNHPQDPRRWRAAVLALEAQPRFVLGFLINGQPAPQPTIDTAAMAAWRKRCDEIVAEVISGDAPVAAREAAEFSVVIRSLIEARTNYFRGTPADWTRARQALESHFAKYGRFGELADELQSRLTLYVTYASWPGQEDFVVGEIRRFANSSVDPVRQEAQRQLDQLAHAGQPLEFDFTALDGRAIDLAKLRGKVVLIDFWATWCGPCMAELPRLKKLYDDYHDKGLEIVGISLDSARDRGRLQEFCRENGMPWPQYYDGKVWRSDPAVRFGVRAIPDVRILDKSGRMLGNFPREELESVIRRQLGE